MSGKTNRYSGEIRINPISILRNDDFNNEGEINDIHKTLQEAIAINNEISERLQRLKAYLGEYHGAARLQCNYAPGGYIAINGLGDDELLEMKRLGLIDLFDFATDRDWVKQYGRHFGLIWENGRAVSITDL
jgi:hypothetical protein